MSLRSAGDDVVSRIARLLELEGDRWRPHRALELLSFVLGDRAQVGDASRYIFAYARHRGYDLPPYPLAGCGEIREFFADEGVRNVPDWYEKKLGLDERAYEALPSQTIVVVRDRADRRKAFFLDGMRYRNAAAYENLADSGFARFVHVLKPEERRGRKEWRSRLCDGPICPPSVPGYYGSCQ